MTSFAKKWEKTEMFVVLSFWNAMTPDAVLIGPKSKSRPGLKNHYFAV